MTFACGSLCRASITLSLIHISSDPDVTAVAAAVLASGEFKAGANETLLLHAPAGIAAKRLLIVGLGKQAKANVHSVRNAAGTAVRFTKPRGIRELLFALPETKDWSVASGTRAAVEGAFVGDFDPDTYRSDRKDQSVQSLDVYKRQPETFAGICSLCSARILAIS